VCSGGEARVSLDVDCAGDVIFGEKIDPFVCLGRRLAYGDNALNQRARYLKCILNFIAIGKTNCVYISERYFSLELERRHALTDAENEQIMLEQNEIAIDVLK
jgi:hypothetical protein